MNSQWHIPVKVTLAAGLRRNRRLRHTQDCKDTHFTNCGINTVKNTVGTYCSRRYVLPSFGALEICSGNMFIPHRTFKVPVLAYIEEYIYLHTYIPQHTQQHTFTYASMHDIYTCIYKWEKEKFILKILTIVYKHWKAKQLWIVFKNQFCLLEVSRLKNICNYETFSY